jgi:undecaprenyl-diphosphatase
MQPFTIDLFTSINRIAGDYPTLDAVMLFVTHYLPYVMIGVVVVYMLWIYPRVHHYNPLHRLAQTLEFVLTFTTTFVLVQYVKVVVAHPRPFRVLPEVVALIPDQGGYSFPSMHTALTVAVAVSVLVHHRRLGLLLLLFALLVGISRIYVGVHYPVDVLVGGLIGWALAVLFHKIFLKVANHATH